MEKQAAELLDSKAKPLGSLGKLETWSKQLCVLQNTLTPIVEKCALVIFCADHGIAWSENPAKQVSAYPASVTSVVYKALVNGCAAGTVIARAVGIEDVEIVDCGIRWVTQPEATDSSARENLGNPLGTKDFTEEPAMTVEECLKAIELGREQVRKRSGSVQAICIGEIGIGNTTAAAALVCALMQNSPRGRVSSICGRGTGIDDEGFKRKVKCIEMGLELHQDYLSDPLEVLRRLGGLEIASMVGVILEASQRNIAVLVDGYISTAAAYAAWKIVPESKRSMFFSHKSADSGIGVVFEEMEVPYVLDLDFRLGEGTGAVLAFPVLKASAEVATNMISLHKAMAKFR